LTLHIPTFGMMYCQGSSYRDNHKDLS